MRQLQVLLDQVIWNENHWSVWKEIERRWGPEDYQDVVKRKEHEATLKLEWDAKEYARKRKAEYPSIEELIVALYDTDDKAGIDAKRAEVKAKYSKS